MSYCVISCCYAMSYDGGIDEYINEGDQYKNDNRQTLIDVDDTRNARLAAFRRPTVDDNLLVAAPAPAPTYSNYQQMSEQEAL